MLTKWVFVCSVEILANWSRCDYQWDKQQRLGVLNILNLLSTVVTQSFTQAQDSDSSHFKTLARSSFRRRTVVWKLFTWVLNIYSWVSEYDPRWQYILCTTNRLNPIENATGISRSHTNGCSQMVGFSLNGSLRHRDSQCPQYTLKLSTTQSRKCYVIEK